VTLAFQNSVEAFEAFLKDFLVGGYITGVLEFGRTDKSAIGCGFLNSLWRLKFFLRYSSKSVHGHINRPITCTGEKYLVLIL
jgi:hypothetical protein